MKNVLKTTALTAAIVISAATAHAAAASAATGDASVTIQGTLAVSQGTALSFGSITATSDSAAEVAVVARSTEGGSPSYTTGSVTSSTSGNEAVFNITGTANMAIGSITVDNTATLTNDASGDTLAATITPGFTPTAIDSNGDAKLYVGGSIKPAGKLGTYNGQYNVVVNY